MCAKERYKSNDSLFLIYIQPYYDEFNFKSDIFGILYVYIPHGAEVTGMRL